MGEFRTAEMLGDRLNSIEDRLRRVEAIASRAPDQPIAWEMADQYKSVSSGTFEPILHLELPRFDCEVLHTRQVVIADSGVTGELRIRQELTGAVTDVAVVGPGIVQKFVGFQWLHGIHLGDTYEHFIIEARRTAGGGNLTVYYPRLSLFTTRLRVPTAAENGNPTIV